MSQLQNIIEEAFERRAEINPANADAELKQAVASVLADLDAGKLRVATRVGDSQQWETHQWIKKAVLLSFRLEDNVLMDGGYTQYFDKVPSKFADYDEAKFKAGGFRVVPNAMVRRGSYIAKNAVLMPSYVNIGAYVG
ncbi:MAG: 2,3,4,5-tetrahydropyridine-2,6-dicarboxylate N-succinyltransferase, partial [Methylophilaceae bacterium]